MTTNTDLFKGTEITFSDGKTRVVKALTIKHLREFMKVANEMKSDNETGMTDEDIDKMVSAASIALRKSDPALAADKDALEDILDLRTFGEVMAAAMGNPRSDISLNASFMVRSLISIFIKILNLSSIICQNPINNISNFRF
jgi:CRISPR/Cas system type I-B associated protein Csh2 (Cas7 group RAMP superfamily)